MIQYSVIIISSSSKGNSFRRTNSQEHLQNLFLILGLTEFREGTYLKYFARIKFCEFRENDILTVPIFFLVCYNTNQGQIKESEI